MSLKKNNKGSIVIFIRWQEDTPRTADNFKDKGNFGEDDKTEQTKSPIFTNLQKALLFPELYSNYLKLTSRPMLW